MSMELDFEPIERLRRDLRKAATTLTAGELRYLVDAYYQVQEDRKRSANQVRATGEAGEPNEVVQWLNENTGRLENSIKSALDSYTDGHPVGKWTKGIVGIGPVIAAGLLAHIDIERAPTVGHIWSFAGLNPAAEWKKGEKRPWNADLKRLCWLIGESFVKVQNRPGDVYGHLYAERKALEVERNEAGLFADQAAEKLRKCKIGKDTDAYKFYAEGKLPPAHIHERAKRWAVKLFLAHLHEYWYRWHFKAEPPKPYVIEHLGHVHRIEMPA